MVAGGEIVVIKLDYVVTHSTAISSGFLLPGSVWLINIFGTQDGRYAE